ncbi:MAG TPA: glycoside hydrolase family 28 protein [Bryobacteraceae bacterium]|jgi:polygalacturonase
MRTAPAAFALLSPILLAAGSFQVQDYGAKGDGKSVDTAAIQKAIDAAEKSGGTIVFKPGVYLTGAIFLKSGTHLEIAEGVQLRGVQDLAGYPIMPTRVAGIEMEWPAALINVYEQSGVTVSGKGVVDGDGKVWWDKYWKMRREEYEPKGIRWAADYDCRRPRLIQIYKSSAVKLEGLTLKRSGFWTVHVCYSAKVTVDGVTIRNNEGGKGPSTDGVDIDSSDNVLVEHCDIECNDDAICLKAGRDADGLRVNRPSEHVVIRDDTVRAGAAGVTFGSETSGGIHDVEVERLHVLQGVPNGILFKSASTRGGTIRDINIHDVDMQGVGSAFSVQFNWNPSYSYAKIPQGIKNYPAYWKVLTEPVPPERGLPHLRNVTISDVKAKDTRVAFSVSSYKDSPLLNFTFKNIDVAAGTAGKIQNASNWKFENVHIATADGSTVSP